MEHSNGMTLVLNRVKLTSSQASKEVNHGPLTEDLMD